MYSVARATNQSWSMTCEGWGRSFFVRPYESQPLSNFNPCMILWTRSPGGPWVVGVSWIWTAWSHLKPQAFLAHFHLPVMRRLAKTREMKILKIWRWKILCIHLIMSVKAGVLPGFRKCLILFFCILWELYWWVTSVSTCLCAEWFWERFLFKDYLQTCDRRDSGVSRPWNIYAVASAAVRMLCSFIYLLAVRCGVSLTGGMIQWKWVLSVVTMW